jgi:cytochrome P450
MLNADSASESTSPSGVASFITDAVGDVGRPQRTLVASPDLSHLPGDASWVAAVRNVVQPAWRGVTYFVELQTRYGRVFRTRVGPKQAVIVADPELVASITKNEDGAWSAALGWQSFFDGIDSSSETLDMVQTLDFEPHRNARRLLQPAFTPAATAGYVAHAIPKFQAAVARWTSAGRVDFKDAIRRLLAEVSAQIFLGIDDPREGELLDESLAAIWGGTFAIARNRTLSGAWRRAVDAHTRLRETLAARIPERRARGGDDLFSRLCVDPEAAGALDDARIVRLFISLLLGAFDSTAAGMAGMAYLLAKNPDWQERLREEAASVAPGEDGRVGYQEIKRLDAIERAWKESLRVLPVTGFLARTPLRDVDLDGARVPAGTFVALAAGPLMRDSRWWQDPDTFDPDRFTPERAEDRKLRGGYLPFGSGAHACIGTHLALVEVKAFWHAMLTCCRFRLERDYEARHTYTPIGKVSGRVALALEPIGA